jgi:uncharacterized protein YndB with AHSA1/START domain
MIVNYQSEFPIDDATCRAATGQSLSQWFSAIDQHGGTSLKRRDAIQWIYENCNKHAWWSTTLWVEYERARGVVQKDGRAEGYNICVTKTLTASIHQVYLALTERAAWHNWFGELREFEVTVGGRFLDLEGNMGEFLRVRVDKDLRFSWQGKQSPAPTQVDIALAAKGAAKTGITLTHNRIQQRDEADGLREAWSQAFDRLKSLVEHP